MTYAASQGSGAMVLSLDAEKVFHCVSWKHLFQAWVRFGFGNYLILWIRIPYSEPRAAISVNGHLSEPSNLKRGTHQGCSLSPVLLAICIEPLTQMIRDNLSIAGMMKGEEEGTISLHADDTFVHESMFHTCFKNNLGTTIK